MSDVPLTSAVITDVDQELGDGYDTEKGRELAKYVGDICEHWGKERAELTREKSWDKDWDFLSKQQQWDTASLPTFRRPIITNIWRRAYHVCLATVMGNRPMLKLVPQGQMDPQTFQVWQSALWANLKTQRVMDEYADAWGWAQVGDGGVLKIGYGHAAGHPNEPPDVWTKSIHPKKAFFDPECTDPSLEACSGILFRDTLDLSLITSRYPEQGWRVQPDGAVSLPWRDQAPAWAMQHGSGTIAPAGGWTGTEAYKRARATVMEWWTDDPAAEVIFEKRVTNLPGLVAQLMPILMQQRGLRPWAQIEHAQGRLSTLARDPSLDNFHDAIPFLGETFGEQEFTPEVFDYKRTQALYPYGRVITCTDEVVLRDIPNPYGPAWGWARRWPFVFVEGAHQPHTLYRPGLLADLSELSRAINKADSLVLENAIKVTAMMLIADSNAMDDEDFDNLSIVPGVKIRKSPGSEVRVEFPPPLPEAAFHLSKYFTDRLESVVGLHDPPVSPGQAVAAKTVAFMQQKGSFILGIMAKLGDEALERVGQRIVGLMRARYLPGRPIPLFEGERVTGLAPLPELPDALTMRVEASSGLQELLASGAVAAEAEAKMKKMGGKK